MPQLSFADRFERRAIPVEEFGHKEHVRAARELLLKYSFLEATARYAAVIQEMAAAAGAAEKFNVTVTVAFMSLIAEKLEEEDTESFETFYASHPELRRGTLDPWYSANRRTCELSRRVFLMPDLNAQSV